MAQEKETRINDAITAPRVRLIGVEGEVLGIMSLSEAFMKAEQAETDIVEIAPIANPPVCRLMDYGKYKYAETKRQHEVKLKQKQKQIKEVKFRLGTDDGDYKIKIRNIVRFITGGDKAKISLRFRGREGTRHEFGIALLKRIEADLTSCAIVEQHPKLEGRQMVMMLAPIKKKS